MTRLMSVWTSAIRPAIVSVATPISATRSETSGASEKSGHMRAIR